jgi:RHS repeat-associated protein
LVTATIAYGAYGEILSQTGTANTPFLFNGFWGVQTDSNRLNFNRARYYHPALRRWLNRDPAGLAGGLNLYAYVGNNPVSGIDPLGLWNIWNPLTYGLPRQPGENPWNPVDSSAEWKATGQGALQNMSIVAGGGGGAGVVGNVQVSRDVNGGSAALDGGLGGGGAAYAGIQGVIGNANPDFSVGGMGGAGLVGGLSVGFTVVDIPYFNGPISVPIPSGITIFGGIGAGLEGKVDIQPSGNIGTLNVDNNGNVTGSYIGQKKGCP